MTAVAWVRRRHHGASSAPSRKLIARDLAPGDLLELDRGHRCERVLSVTRNDGSRTVDIEFESGRRGTFRYQTGLTVRGS